MKSLIIFSICVLATLASSQIPRTISYQGILTDGTGAFVPDGNHSLTLKLYETASGGTAIYEESHSTAVIKGLFGVIIGSVSPLPANLSFDKAYYLGVAVNGGTELVPRAALTAAPYALYATTAGEARSLAAGVTGVVSSINSQSGSLTLEGAGSTTVNVNGPIVTISSTGGSGGTGIQGVQSTDGTLTIDNSTGPIADLKLANNAVTSAHIDPENAAGGYVLTADSNGSATWTAPSAAQLLLPYKGIVTGTTAVFSITNSGAGRAIEASATSAGAVVGDNTSTNVAAVIGHNKSSGIGVHGYSSSSGVGVLGQAGVNGGTGTAGKFENFNSSNGSTTLIVTTNGRNATPFLANHSGSGGNLAIFQSGSENKARIDRFGKGFFNAGTQNSGADLAEAFAVAGDIRTYEPGDVLVISPQYARTAEKCSVPYAANVIGVHATKPGVLLTERAVDADLSDLVPIGIVGVLPTKVTNEGGAIRPGDLLVTSSTPGHAMKANSEKLRFGMVLGKALEHFQASRGVILVFVNVK